MIKIMIMGEVKKIGDAPVSVLVIVCILALVVIVSAISIYLSKTSGAIQFNSNDNIAGQAYVVADNSNPSDPGFTVTHPLTNPTAYAYNRNSQS